MNHNEWFLKKKRLDGFSDNVFKVISDYEMNSPRDVKSSYSGKYLRTEVKIEDDMFLYVYQTKSEGLKKAIYTLYEDRGTVYTRIIT